MGYGGRGGYVQPTCSCADPLAIPLELNTAEHSMDPRYISANVQHQYAKDGVCDNLPTARLGEDCGAEIAVCAPVSAV